MKKADIFQWISRILIIGLILYAAFVLVRTATAAPNATVIMIDHQGQEVYLGDTINVQKVLAFGSMLAFAWYDDDIYDETPDQIYEVKGDQHRFYLDPLTFKTGTYFKWSGSFNRAEYPVAFVVVGARRPAPIPTAADKATPVPTRTPEPGNMTAEETHIYLARGDDLHFMYSLSEDATENQQGYIWLFPAKWNSKSLMGEPLYRIPPNTTYQYSFQPILTEELAEGWYTGYLQFTGKNGYQDVYYNYRENTLDTPYDDSIIPDVNLDPWIPIRYKQEFEKLAKPSVYFDDVLIPITMYVIYPYIQLNEYYEDEDSVIVEGTTSLSEGTNLTFMIDPSRWALEKDIAQHTWNTNAAGTIKEPRTFYTKMKIDWDEMAVGEHSVRGSVEKHKIETEGHIHFQVTDLYVMPTPTPVYERVIVEQYGTHRLNATNRTAILLENTTWIDNSTRVIVPDVPQFNSTDITTTPEPTAPPVTTAPTPTPVPTPKPTPTIKVPVEFTTIMVAVGLGIWRKKK